MSSLERPSILVVEDDGQLRRTIVAGLEAEAFVVAESATAVDAAERLEGFAYDGLVVDLNLDGADGMAVLDDALARYPEIRAVVMTGFGGVEQAVRAMKRGAVDFLIKPFQLVQLVSVLQTSISERRLRRENAELRAKLHDHFRLGGMIGASKSMQHVVSTLELVAPMNSTVLIEGETGTGKELIARTIHHNSPRREQAFVAFNAAAIPESLAETELFGHVKGAFTGATTARVGRFEMADRGTIFIDEVASMSMALQAKLLRVLQEREIERVGTSKPIKIDTRVIAASNVNLYQMVRDGNLREDLFYRLNVIRVSLPPLRARLEDIPALAQHFAAQSCRNNGLPLRNLNQAAIRLLMQYHWPGNIRQLENAIEAAVALSGTSTEITPDMLPEQIRGTGEAPTVPMVPIPDEGINFSSLISQFERDLIVRCLERTGGNKRQAARLLNLSRTTLVDKLHRLGITDGSAA